MAKRLMVRPGVCIGCRSCELICNYTRTGEFGCSVSAVSVHDFDEAGIAVPLMCMQCEEALCLSACRLGALSRDETTDSVVYDREKCVLCGMCENSCRLGGIYQDNRLSSIIKCVLCDGDPQCVKVCPVSAIDYAEVRKNDDS